MTTFIVMLYLLVNITGRFSVAIFGLTYNLVDDAIKVYPTLTTYWDSSVLLAKNATNFEVVEESLRKNSTPRQYLGCIATLIDLSCSIILRFGSRWISYT